VTARLEGGGWVCPKCEGSGFVLDANDEAVPCDCHEMRVRKARSSGVSSVIPRKFRGVSFDRAPVPDLQATHPDAVRSVKQFIHDMEERLRTGKGMWFMGDVGTGKTTLAMLISKEALDRGHSVAIYSVPRLLAEIRQTYEDKVGDRSYMEFFRRLVAVDLLHLEDLGAERQTDWVLEQLYSLVNQRYEDQRSIIVTSNVQTPAELEEQVGMRTVSRLTEICGHEIMLFGPDQRIAYDPARTALG
jgi:DNA replication protein DnaC